MTLWLHSLGFDHFVYFILLLKFGLRLIEKKERKKLRKNTNICEEK